MVSPLPFPAVALACLSWFSFASPLRAQRTPLTPSREMSSTAHPAAMTNADVISLVSAGLGEALVAEKVRTASSTAFDTSVEGLKALKAGNVPDEVIHAMLESSAGPAGYSNSDDPALMHMPGIYAQIAGHDGQAHLLLLEHTEAIGAKGNGHPLSNTGSGLARAGVPFAGVMGKGKTHIKAALNDPKSPVQIDDQNPSFYLYTTEDTQRFGGSEFSARDFTLVKLHQTDKTREIEISTIRGGYNSGMEAPEYGIDDKVRQPTVTQKLKPGIYLIKLAQPLKPGEYAFEHLLDGIFYDFGITGAR
jgi:hypothetical protein